MTPHAEPHVVLLPGLGADGRLFASQREVFPNLLTPPWPPPERRESLASYAARLARDVPHVRPLVLGGCSFGGMVACEMARLLRPEALVLIGSVAAPWEIPAAIRILAGLARVMPVAGFRLTRIAAPLVGHLVGVHRDEHQRPFVAMLRNTPPAFTRWACTAIAGWRCEPLVGIPTFVIQGANDHVLPVGRRSVDVVVPGAGHLLTITHPREVNEFLHWIKQQLPRS